jgi:hypothetical protein
LVKSNGLDIRFDYACKFSRREDLIFSFDAILKGARFLSAPKGVLIEKFSKGRSTFKYLLKRWFENGISDVMIAKRYNFGIKIRIFKEVFNILLRLASIPFSAVCGVKSLGIKILKTAASWSWLCGIFEKQADYYLKHEDFMSVNILKLPKSGDLFSFTSENF